MEIIVKGTRMEERKAAAKAWRRTITHRRCGSILKIGAGDIKPPDYHGWRTYCIVCSRRIQLWFLPRVVKELVQGEHGCY